MKLFYFVIAFNVKNLFWYFVLVLVVVVSFFVTKSLLLHILM